MTEFRDDIVELLIQRVGHPDPVLQALIVLRDALKVKLDDAEDCEPQVKGLEEARALLTNLMVDLHVNYGVPTPTEKEEEHADSV